MFLHIYGQNLWHDACSIIGTRAQLEQLRTAIDHVLTTGKNAVFDAFVNDGEGFQCFVGECDRLGIDQLTSPYHDVCDPFKTKKFPSQFLSEKPCQKLDSPASSQS